MSGATIMKNKFQEKGQALVIIALAAVVLFGFAALAIDGSMVFSDKRHAQNAADTAALAAALVFTRGGDNIAINSTAQARTLSNGYNNNGTSNIVTVTTTDIPDWGCPGNADGKLITVNIESKVQTSLARVVGTAQITNRVKATARGCGYIVAPLFSGNAIVSLNPANNPCAFDSGNSNAAHWKIQGSGIFSNGCAYSKNGNSVTLDPGECVTSVGTASNFSCSQQSQPITPAEVLAIMPPNPCDGDPGDVGLPQGSGVSSGGSVTFSNGVYCISNMDALDQKDVILNNATLYVTDFDFSLKFAGGGGFSGTPSSSGDFTNFYMVIAIANPPCPDFNSQNAQVIQFRGNGSGTFSGTILAPSACLDLRGNGETSGIHSQVIGYNVTTNPEPLTIVCTVRCRLGVGEGG
jgi:Flp pilus assembly protein TadG